MKKTIAILLVMSLALVGVFAAPTAPSDVDLTIGTVVDPINLMGLSTSDTAPTGNDWSSIGDLEVANTVITSDAETHVAYLHTKSNDAVGYTVTMTAGLLASDDVASLPYTVKAYDGTTEKGSATTTTAASGAEEIIKVTTLSELTVTSRDIKVTIPTYDTAPAGTYEGIITFNYTAN